MDNPETPQDPSHLESKPKLQADTVLIIGNAAGHADEITKAFGQNQVRTETLAVPVSDDPEEVKNFIDETIAKFGSGRYARALCDLSFMDKFPSIRNSILHLSIEGGTRLVPVVKEEELDRSGNLPPELPLAIRQLVPFRVNDTRAPISNTVARMAEYLPKTTTLSSE